MGVGRVGARGSGRRLAARVDEIVAVLERGGVVVLPTDTVYGLAALPTSPDAVERVFALKGRRADVPLAVLCAVGRAGPRAGRTGRRASAGSRRGSGRGRSRSCCRGEPGSRCTSASRSTRSGCGCRTTTWCAPSRPRSGPIAATSANRHGEPTPPDRGRGGGVAHRRRRTSWSTAGGWTASASTVVDASATPWIGRLRHGPIDPAEVIAAGIG